MSIVNHLPRAWTGPGKRPGIGAPSGEHLNNISGSLFCFADRIRAVLGLVIVIRQIGGSRSLRFGRCSMDQKRLVVCCDGTWNDADSAAEFTNVVRIARAIKPIDSRTNPSTQQVVYYHSGVGTSDALDHVLGGTVGLGLSRATPMPSSRRITAKVTRYSCSAS